MSRNTVYERILSEFVLIGEWVARLLLWVCLALPLAATSPAATFGTVVPIRGQSSDIALDEGRGVLYVANFTGNRIDVVDTVAKSLRSSIFVAPQPASLGLSPDGRYLVITHFGNWGSSSDSSKNAITVLDLQSNARQTFATSSPPLAVAFGADGLAFVVTTTSFSLLNPANGTLQALATIAAVGATLPVEVPTFPSEVTQASMATSRDGQWIYGVASLQLAENNATSDTNLIFRYNVTQKWLYAVGITAAPALGPRVVSVNKDGSTYMAGWGLFNWRGTLLAQFPEASGQYEAGTHAFDPNKGVIYAQFTQTAAQTQTAPSSGGSGAWAKRDAVTPKLAPASEANLLIVDDDNLTVRERLRLPENLSGKSVLSHDGQMLYSVSESGVMLLPVGQLERMPRVGTSAEDLLFRNDFCNRQVIYKEVSIVDPGGGHTDFTLVPSSPGVIIDTPYGVTPAKVRISVDPSAFLNQQGTSMVQVQIQSSSAINTALPIRLLVNNRNPDQRGTIFNVPGKLVDILPDPGRDRFYILRQDKNEVLAFDASSYSLLATLRTGNTPTKMAMTFDRRYLLVGNENSNIANVFDLDTLLPDLFISFPLGHYPRSIATSGRSILSASRVAGPIQTIDRIDLAGRSALPLPSLGIWANDVDADTVLASSPSGNSVFAASADGTTMLYDATADTFIVMRKDFDSLTGGYGALGDTQFAAGDHVLNASLVPLQDFEGGNGHAAGYAFADPYGLRSAATDTASPGVLTRFELGQAAAIRPTRLAEAPVLGDSVSAFRRTVAVLPNRKAIIALTTSGFTAVSWDYDAAVADPKIDSVVNAADYSDGIAPGGLISLFGSDLSPVTIANSEVPVPTALGGTCLTINGAPTPIFYVSSAQVNAQLPFYVTDSATVVLRTPGGASNPYYLSVRSNAPGVFRSGSAGTLTAIPTVVRATNNQFVTLSNPIHIDDHIVIYATGLGRTTGNVDAGAPAPSDPPAQVLVPPDVKIGGYPLPVSYAGLSPGLVGVYQINAKVPFGVPLGMEVPLTISQGGYSTAFNVRVVK